MTTNRVFFQSFGQPEAVLEVVPNRLPELSAGQILVKMLAAPINPADINFIQGTYGIKPELPSGAGLEGCGRVENSMDTNFQPGDLVISLGSVRTWASQVVGTASDFLKIPSSINPQQAAMLKVNPLTALLMIENVRQLPAGSWIAQNAANSGVGRCVIQIAKQLGLHTLNFVRREELVPDLLALGADVVLVDNEDLVKNALAATENVRPSLALNAVGGDSALRLMDLLAPSGTHVTYGAMSRKSLKVPNGMLIFKDISIVGFWLTKWLKSATRLEVEATYGRLAKWMTEGNLNQQIEKSHPIADVREACLRAQQESRQGKILLSFE